MTRMITLGLVQMEPCLGDIEANLNRVLSQAESCARRGANMVIFPELALTGYNQELLGDRMVSLALSASDLPVQRLAEAAGRLGIYLVAGFIEKRQIPGVLYNSIVFCGPDGTILGTYAKSHLFSAENLHFRPGAELKVIQTRYGAVGPMICMDIGYPEVARLLALQGAELLIAPSAWITVDEDLWALHLRARALDNLAFVAGINRVGSEGNLHFIGQSLVADPRGHELARLGSGEDILLTSIDLDQVALERRKALHWTGRRPDLYGPISDRRVN